jgi:acetyltransferase-like isoleucine patch superfamily enzyme
VRAAAPPTARRPGDVVIHPAAEVHARARIGAGTRIWRNAQIREDARVGRECVVGKDVYIGARVRVGSRVKIQNGALVYEGSVVADEVFIGPQVCLANDRRPRAATIAGDLRTAADWKMEGVRLERGASVGAQSVLVPPLRIGRHAMVGAGSVVIREVRAFELVAGSPARHIGWVCRCGERLPDAHGRAHCRACGLVYVVGTRGVRSLAQRSR